MRTLLCCEGVEGTETRERRGAAEEKNALFLLAVLTALLERRVTPRLVNIVSDDGVGEEKDGEEGW